MARYTIDTIELTSPTSVADLLDKPAIPYWAVGLAVKYIEQGYFYEDRRLSELLKAASVEWKRVKEEAMDIGSEVHDIIEKYIKHGRDVFRNLRPEVENAVLAFLEWEKKHVVKWFHSELTVVSKKYCYAGTLDAIALMKDKEKGNVKRVIDFKSSKGFYDGYGKQIAAYKLAVEEMDELSIKVVKQNGKLVTVPNKDKYGPIDGCGILRLDKLTGEPDWRDYDKVQDRKAASWLKLLDYYYSDKKRRLKNNPRAK
jgi:hypothetical protein